MTIDPKQFWEEKLVQWEDGRYGSPPRATGLLEWIADRSSMSLRYRVDVTVKLLEPYVQGKRIVEFGCGSGQLARKFIEFGATSYFGVDIAEAAIENARRLNAGEDRRIEFRVGSVSDLPSVSADIVFSLGLLDWLQDAEIAHLFRASGRAHFLHAIAEKRPSLQQLLHRSYVQLAYGYRTKSYRPRYFRPQHIKTLADSVERRPLYIYRNWRLSFGALISTLPIGPEI
jgi:SAM-dependent methyltransferase